MRLALLYSLFLIAIFNFSYAQNSFPQDYFGSPLKNDLLLSGNFGEIRPNHFHSGFDIKTNGKEGAEIFAVAEGYISRIKISPYGYGNALYITHPNGYTSIYAHLKSFNAQITKYVRAIQYTNEQFELDTTLSPNLFAIQKGSFIALSGNTGGSQGPHLHFEIRDTQTEKPINPHLFGYKVSDKTAPKIEKIVVYPMDENSIINEKYQTKEIIPLLKKNVQLIEEKDSLIIGGSIAIGIECYDMDEQSKNKNAVYSIELKMDEERIYYHEMNSFSFENTRYVNAHIDYEAKQKKKDVIQKCFKAKNNEIEIYYLIKENGIMKFNDGQTHLLKLIAKDFEGNTTELNIKVISLTKDAIPESFTNTVNISFMDCLKSNQIKRSDLVVELPEKALYDDVNFSYSKTTDQRFPYAPVHRIHNSYTALQKNMQLHIQTMNVPEVLKSKLCIVLLGEKDKQTYSGGTYANGWVSSQTKQLGDYAIVVDTLAPVIKPVFKMPETGIADFGAIKKVQFIISDNLSGVVKYAARVDNKWVLLENDAKNNLFTLVLPTNITSGFHDLIISITDDKNNHSNWECFFKIP